MRTVQGGGTTFHSLLALLLGLLVVAPVWGDSTTGTVHGVVKEQSGGVIPGVEVLLINQGTNVRTTVLSDDEGGFVLNLVPPGQYALEVSHPGFRTAVVKGVLVEINKNTRVDVLLTVGELSNSIEVLASATTQRIDTRSAQVGTNVAEHYVSELPSFSRNALEYALMAPGVELDTSQIAGGSQVLNIQGTYASVNGNRNQRNSFYLDGSDNSGSYRNSALQFPNPDAVREVQVSTSNTSAEFGRQSGGTFNVVTKSGTNEFHGSGFYFFRNKNLNANSWSRNRNASPRPDDNWRQLGGTLGGPIWKDRTFFFASFMAFRDKNAGYQSTHRFPTAKMLAGDFSEIPGQLYDPVTKQAIPNNDLKAANLIDPAALAYAKLLPTVAQFGDRFIWDFERPMSNHEALAKVDHQINSANSLAFSYFRTWGNAEYPDQDGAINHVPAAGPQLNTSHQTTIAGRHAWTISPQFVLENRLSVAIHVADRVNANLGKDLADFGASNYPLAQEGARKYQPQITISDGFNTRQGWLSLFDQANYRFGSTVTWITGSHNLKLGGEAQRDKVRQFNDQDSAQFDFDGRYSSLNKQKGKFGWAFADFMMGRTYNFSVRGILDYDVYSWSNFFFAQDTWKLTPRLTLTPGLRYEFYMPPQEKNQKLNTFIDGFQSTLYPNAPRHMAFVGDPGVPEGLYAQDWNNLAPRIGLAYDVTGDGRTALRGGFGAYYSFNAAQIKMLVTEQNPWRPNAVGSEALFKDPWLTSTSPVYTTPPTPFDPNPSTYKWPSLVPRLVGFADDFATPYTLQWNFALEREIRSGLTLTAGYVGNRGYKLTQILPANFPLWKAGATDSAVNMDSRRPYSEYREIHLMHTRAKSWYDSLQVTGDVQLFGWLSNRLSYVLAKGFDVAGDPNNANVQTANPLDPDGEKAQSGRRHTFRSFYIVDLPFLRNDPRLVGRILGGWQISGKAYMGTGRPQNVTLGLDWNYDGISGDRPDLVAPIQYARLENPNGTYQWLDVAQSPFATPGGGVDHNVWGNLARDAVWGPGTWNVDLALSKDFQMREAMKIQIRLEGYNVFNNNNLDNPNLNMRSADFNKILTRSGSREMQVGLRFVF